MTSKELVTYQRNSTALFTVQYVYSVLIEFNDDENYDDEDTFDFDLDMIMGRKP